MKKIIVFAFTIFYGLTLYAQKDKPTSENISYAKSLKSDYKDEDVVIKKKQVELFFSRNTRTQKVEVKEYKSYEYIAISKRADLGYSSGYDNQSSIVSLELLDRKNKTLVWNLFDKAYSDESIFHNDYRVKYGTFSLPLLGYTKIVKEEKKYDDIKYYTTTYFTEPYRTMAGKLIIHIPDWLDLDLKEFNFEGYDLSSETSKGKDERILTYTLKNIAPVVSEPNSPGDSFLYPHLFFLPKSFQSKTNESITLFKETKDLYAWYASLVKDVEIDNTNFAEKVKDLIEGKTTDEAKIKAIYYWVQDNIKYIAFENGIAGFKPDTPQNVYNKKYGDCKGMAILLKSMLKEAGFDARLVWIGTNTIAYDYSTPSLAVDNHMITAVIKDGQPIFLDGTEKFNSYGSFSSRIQGKQALVENGDSFILKTIPKTKPSFNKETYTADLKIVDENIIGDVTKTLSGEQIGQFLFGYNNTPKDVRKDALTHILKDGNENASISNIDGFDPLNRDDAIHLTYTVELDGVVSSFDDEIYLELDPVKYLYNFKIDNDRKNPIQFYNTNIDEKEISLTIPDGYKISSYPEKLSIENNVFSAEASYSITSDKVNYTCSIVFKKTTVEKSEFQNWNTAINQLKTFYDEQIVLTKS